MAVGGKQKGPKPRKDGGRHREHNAPGGPANPFGSRPDKAALVERMKAAARRGQTAGTDPGVEGEPEVRSEGDA